MPIQKNMFKELEDKSIFEQAKSYAYDYADQVDKMPVFPTKDSLELMRHFEEPLTENGIAAADILKQLNDFGSPNTIAQTGGRYFGFVNGNVLPVSLAVKWLTDFWDQCAGLYLASPINAKLESVCEAWLKELFGLPESTVAGFVSGTTMANLSALAAARYRLLMNMGWDVNEKGLNGAPQIRIIAHEDVHASIKGTLRILGFGLNNIEWFGADVQGRLDPDQMPELDASCLVLTQAGNVNSGAYDPFEIVCEKARAVGAWVHVDGAFGLWAATCKSLKHLTKGIHLANSWAVDGHKTLNTPYDSGIVMCADEDALVNALTAQADYLVLDKDNRDPIHYSPEMSKRARAIELWACMKYLGKSGIDEMITGMHQHAKAIAQGLEHAGYNVLNEVVFNQVIVSCETEEKTKKLLSQVQQTGELWCGGSKWKGKEVIRISVCSWATTEADVKRVVEVFEKSLRSLS